MYVIIVNINSSAWRKACNNCDTKKPRNPESVERELAEERKGIERRTRETTSREHSRENKHIQETEKHGRFHEKDKPGPSRERGYDQTDDYVDNKDRNQRQRNESEHLARQRYSREDQARGGKERHRYEFGRDQPIHQQHDSQHRVNPGHYKREQQDYNRGAFRENRHELERHDRDQYTSDRHEHRRSDHNRSRNDMYDYERSGRKPHDSNRYESSRYEHESYDRDDRQTREGASRRRHDDQRDQFSYEMYPTDKPPRDRDRDHRDRTR